MPYMDPTGVIVLPTPKNTLPPNCHRFVLFDSPQNESHLMKSLVEWTIPPTKTEFLIRWPHFSSMKFESPARKARLFLVMEISTDFLVAKKMFFFMKPVDIQKPAVNSGKLQVLVIWVGE